jgi:hypothetical protein
MEIVKIIPGALTRVVLKKDRCQFFSRWWRKILGY